MKLLPALALSSLLALAFTAQAQNSHDHQNHNTSASASAAALSDSTAAEVRKVDKDARKITLKHGEIKNLNMAAMTMVFQVKDAALLDKVQAGDQVRFTADKINGAYVVLSIEPVKNN